MCVSIVEVTCRQQIVKEEWIKKTTTPLLHLILSLLFYWFFSSLLSLNPLYMMWHVQCSNYLKWLNAEGHPSETWRPELLFGMARKKGQSYFIPWAILPWMVLWKNQEKGQQWPIRILIINAIPIKCINMKYTYGNKHSFLKVFD